MKRILNSPTPVATPCGSPNQWYSPVNTPLGTPGSTHRFPNHEASTPKSILSSRSSSDPPSPLSSEEYCSTSPGPTSTAPGQTSLNYAAESSAPSAVSYSGPSQIDADSDYDKQIRPQNSDIEHNTDTQGTNTGQETSKKSKLPFTWSQIFTVIILGFSGICSSMFGSLLAPFFPTEAIKKGASQTWVGLMFGSYQLIGFIASPILGAYLTVIGAKFMYVSGIIVNSACAILFGTLQWCPAGNIYIIMCFCSRSLEALGAAAIGTANKAIATHAFPDHISTLMGILNACSCIGLMIGPPVGGILFELGGFFLPFAVTGSGFMLCGFISWCFLPAPTVSATSEVRSTIPKWHLLKLPVISVIGYVVFVGQFAMGFIDVTFTIHLQDVQPSLTQKFIGLIFLIAPVVVVLFAPIIGWLADKFQVLNRPIMIVGIVLSALGFMGLGPSPFLTFLPQYSLGVVLGSLAIAGVGWAALVITYQEFVTAAKLHGFPDTLETQGLVSGVYNAYSNFGAFTGPIFGGIMNEHIGFAWSSTVNAIMIGAAGVLLFFYAIIEACCCPPSGEGRNSTDTETLIVEQDDSSRGIVNDSATVVRDGESYKDVYS